MRPFSPHDRFFSSLNQAIITTSFFNLHSAMLIQNTLILLAPQRLQVEKRLASEKELISPPSQVSFSSPLYLSSSIPQPASFKPSTLDESSDPAPEFLSIPPEKAHDLTPPEAVQDDFNDEEEDDEIDGLISLLGLSEDGEDCGGGLGSWYSSGGGFYRKVVGLKGLICEKEMQRLDGWIVHYRRERKEPARLAHLLLAKAVSLAGRDWGTDDDNDAAFGEIGFPSTVEEFLGHDPPFEKITRRPKATASFSL